MDFPTSARCGTSTTTMRYGSACSDGPAFTTGCPTIRAFGFEIAGDSPPYFGVRGRGTANLLAAAEVDVLPRLLDRYGIDRDSSLASWLLSRRATELTIKLMPEWITSWDYRDRMS